jgi:GNAT superfamily N-acetyltransferase
MHPIIHAAAASDPRSVAMIRELDAELSQSYAPEQMHGLHPGEEGDPHLRFFLLELDGVAIGCGALRDLGSGVAELKRMFVRPAHRGRGFARNLLTQLEGVASSAGIRRLRLETGTAQRAALSLYRSAGYTDIPAYGEYIGSPTSVCMEKALPAK